MGSKLTVMQLGEGEVRAPSGWRAASERDLVKDGEVNSAPLAMNRAMAAPRLQVSLLAASSGQEPEALLLAVYEAMRKRSDGVLLKERGKFEFDDKTAGAKLVIEVEPLPGFRATQIHVARGPHHLLANIPATAGAKAIAEVSAVLKSFKPRA